jgi:hypothetical protein
MYDNFLQKIKTRREADELSEEANLLIRGLYEQEGKAYESYLNTKVRSWVSRQVKEVFSEEGVDKKGFLEGLLNNLNNLKPVRLVIAFEPTENQLERFTSFIKSAGGQNLIVDLTYDPYVVGGAVIIHEGKYRDFSFKKIFEHQFENERENLLKLLEKSKVSEEN